MLRIDTAPVRGDGALFPGMPAWMSRLLQARGVRNEADAQAFLHPSLNQLLPPSLLSDMDKAAELLTAAKDKGWRAAIWGDYDVDGVCASAVLRETFDRMGLDCRVYLPDRHREGYGLNRAGVEALAQDCQVLVTVDCGITGIGEVERARELGMAVIVTDHHRHGDALPPADAVISPLLGDYPFPFLCGAGVAWKLAMRLLGNGALDLMELAALATVADMVPLTGENRCITALGLERLSATGRPGLRAVMNRSGVFGRVSSDQVGFQIGPRMNACGRLESAGTALQMLLTRDPVEAEALALRMEKLNRDRKDLENKVLTEALSQVDRMDLVTTRAIVVCGDDWNSGVVGLAAGRIAEKYAYPTVALARDGDTCVGSARSAGDVDIYLALSQCADLFLRFGGHRQAAGLTLPWDRVEEFKARLSRAVEEQTGGLPPETLILCDGELTLREVTEETVRWLEKLEPCGTGNPAPRFLCRDVQAVALQAVGADRRHLKCTFQQDGELRDGILFGGGDQAGQTMARYRMAMTPTLNAFRGKVSAECRLFALQLLPETLEENRAAEGEAYLAEALSSDGTPVITEREADSRMAGGQGTALVCRCLKTAMYWRKKFPHADFRLRKADDPRAYHTVLLYGTADKACASYRHVVLCDGDLGEGSAWKKACPLADVAALAESGQAREMLSALWLNQTALRDACRWILSRRPMDLTGWAAEKGYTDAQAAFALRVLTEIGVAAREGTAGALTLTGQKRGPEESALYRRVRQAKEATDGLYDL